MRLRPGRAYLLVNGSRRLAAELLGELPRGREQGFAQSLEVVERVAAVGAGAADAHANGRVALEDRHRDAAHVVVRLAVVDGVALLPDQTQLAPQGVGVGDGVGGEGRQAGRDDGVDDRLVLERQERLADRRAVQLAAIADLEVDGHELRSLDVLDEDGLGAIEDLEVHAFMRLGGDPFQGLSSEPDDLVLGQQVPAQGHHAIAHGVAAGSGLLVHVAGSDERGQHPVRGAAAHAGAHRDVAQAEWARLRGDDLEDVQRLQRRAADAVA